MLPMNAPHSRSCEGSLLVKILHGESQQGAILGGLNKELSYGSLIRSLHRDLNQVPSFTESFEKEPS